MAPSSTSAKSTPKDVFLYLLSIFALYVSVISFLVLLFQYINVLFPDPLSFYRSGVLDSIRWSSASLIVVFPVYILTCWLIGRDIAMEPMKAELRVRKWLVYLTLFIAAITIITDLITLIYNFLSGDLTTPFLLKILVVLIVTGTVFGYYLWDLRRTDSADRSMSTLIGWVVSALVAASIIGGFFLVGSPFYQRQVRFDERRTNDLSMIQNHIIYQHWVPKGKLPQTLDELKDSISGFVPPVDPKTGASYEYKVVSVMSFELCATFGTVSESNIPAPRGDAMEQWLHGEGRTCFTRTIDPQIYKPDPSMLKPVLR